MARAQSRHSTDIPKYLWKVLDTAAKAEGVTTAQLIAAWLTEAAHHHADDRDRHPAIRRQLAALPHVDGRYTYQRRVGTPLARLVEASL